VKPKSSTDNSAPTPGNKTRPVNFGKLSSYLGYQVRQAQIAVFRDISDRLKELEITPGEFSLLTLVNNNPDISQTALVKIYNLDKSTLSHAINRLVDRGLIERKRPAHDKRLYALKLTSSGLAVLLKATHEIETQEDIMDHALRPQEREQFLDMLLRITNKLNPE
jgi:DNA-binding MarR family transcriptional regulator